METKNLDIYGHEPIPWSRVERQLGDGAEPFGASRWSFGKD